MRLLNGIGIFAAIKPAGSQIDLLRYLDTDRTLGVFVDVRCSNQNVSGIFDQVGILFSVLITLSQNFNIFADR